MSTKSVYLPDTCIQNDKFPAHVMWEKELRPIIKIVIPEGIEYEEIYNVDEKDIIFENNTLVLSNFEVNGYVGFVFKSSIFDTPKVFKSFNIIIEYPNFDEIQEYNKKIELFRPDIELQYVPEKINVEYNKEKDSFFFSDKIILRNNGEGTAHLSVSIVDDSEIKIKEPENLKEFRLRFISDLKIEFLDLKEKYPEYHGLFDDFIELFENPTFLNNESIEKIKKFFDDLENAFEINENFSDDFNKSVGIAYFKNVQNITKIEEFLNYLNSVERNKIVILNSIDNILVPKNESNLNISIEKTDYAFNEYPKINLPEINIFSEFECKIPLHLLFEWNKSEVK